VPNEHPFPEPDSSETSATSRFLLGLLPSCWRRRAEHCAVPTHLVLAGTTSDVQRLGLNRLESIVSHWSIVSATSDTVLASGVRAERRRDEPGRVSVGHPQRRGRGRFR
jgi:hypothetical protein